MEENEKKDKYIFTDSYRTKDLLWEAYTGFIDSYNDFQMLRTTFNRKDLITLATMNKYAYYFYDEIEDFLEDFKDAIKNIDDIKNIFKQTKILDDDYITLRKFFAKFMKVSGIKNIVKEKEHPGKSIRINR